MLVAVLWELKTFKRGYLIMKYDGSPFGKMSGAIAGQVTSSWKGIKYGRAYVVPNNPQTVNQTLQRTIFKNVSEFGRRIVDTVLNPFTIPAPKLMSAFNKFVSTNAKIQGGLTLVYNTIKLTLGSLYNPEITDVVADESLHTAVVTWGTTLIGEAANDDTANVVIYDIDRDIFYYGTPVNRSVGTMTIAIPGALSGEQICCWLFFVNAAGTMTSDSNGVMDSVVA
jgi:hypothetical protein